MKIPSIDPTYYCPDPAFWGRIAKRSDTGTIINVLIAGPTGTGKTTFSEQFAANFNRPFFSLECGAVAEAEQLIGQWEVRPSASGQTSYTQFNLSGFLEAVQTPHAVINLNEVNRFQSIKAENAVFSLLDHQRELFVQEIHKNIKVAPGVVFFATINEGAEYTGTDIMDMAFNNRWSRRIELDWLPADKEETILIKRTGCDKDLAKNLVKLATNLRGHSPISLRQLQAAAEEYIDGAPIDQAIIIALSSVCEKDELTTMAATTIKGFTKAA